MRCVGTGHVRCPDRLYQLLAVISELVDRMRVIVDNPNVLLRVVGADINRVWTFEHLVPLGPLLDDVALCVDDDQAVFPAGVYAQLSIGRRRSAPQFHSPCRILARTSGARRRGGVGVAPWQPSERKLHIRSDLGKESRLRTWNVRQLAAAQQIYAIRAFREDSPSPAVCPLLVAGESAEILWPTLDDFI